MKKVLIVLFMMFILVGCTDDSINEFDQAMLNMKELDSYTYSFSITAQDGSSSFQLTVLLDGDNKYKFNDDGVDYYEFPIDGVVHLLHGECRVSEKDIDEDEEDESSAFDLLSEDFDFDGEYYIPKELETDMISYKIKIENGYMIEFLFEHIREDVTYNHIWEYTDFNTTEVIISDCAFD